MCLKRELSLHNSNAVLGIAGRSGCDSGETLFPCSLQNLLFKQSWSVLTPISVNTDMTVDFSYEKHFAPNPRILPWLEGSTCRPPALRGWLGSIYRSLFLPLCKNNSGTQQKQNTRHLLGSASVHAGGGTGQEGLHQRERSKTKVTHFFFPVWAPCS